MTMDNGMIADIAAATRPNFIGGGGFGGDWLAVLVLFALFGGYGGGFGGNGNGLTQAQLQNGFDTQNILRNQEGLENGLAQLGYATNTSILENRFAAEKCCCETQRQIDSVKYANQQNTCDIINAIHDEGEKTRKQLTQDRIDKMQEKINELTSIVQNQAQNAYLINQLTPPKPVPAFVVPNPYTVPTTTAPAA